MGIKDVNMRNGDNLPIRQFKLAQMVKNPAIMMIAKRGSGKSWIVRAIMMHFNSIPCGVVISPTDRMSSFYNDFFPDTYIHYKYESRLITRILDRQSQMIDKEKQGKKLDPRAFIIMDDCLGDKKSWVNDAPVLELLFNGRHYQIMYILTMQYPLGITPQLRANFDYIFLLREDFINNQKKLYDHYAGMFPTFDSFRQVFTELVADYGCMVIDNRSQTENPLEKIFWYKAEDLTGVKKMMGGKQFLQFHYNNYDKNWRNKSREYDFVAWSNNIKKNKAIIRVEKEELDENGNVVDRKEKSTNNFNKLHQKNYNQQYSQQYGQSYGQYGNF